MSTITLRVDDKEFSLNVSTVDEESLTNALSELRNMYYYSVGYGRYGKK